jgi:ADP-ribose pyrophosphatase YjhB (NUDIX family)
MNERVRAVLITPGAELLTIRRDRPDAATYRVLPGGHVEPTDPSLEDALIREIREELAGEPAIHSLLRVLESEADRQYFYLATIDTWAFDQRTGPEFDEPSRAEYAIDLIPLTSDDVARSNLKPDAIADFLCRSLSEGGFFAVPTSAPTTPGPDDNANAAGPPKPQCRSRNQTSGRMALWYGLSSSVDSVETWHDVPGGHINVMPPCGDEVGGGVRVRPAQFQDGRGVGRRRSRPEIRPAGATGAAAQTVRRTGVPSTRAG